MYIDSVKFIPNIFSKHFENQLDSNTLCPEQNCMVKMVLSLKDNSNIVRQNYVILIYLKA